jgi:g-D-glutamyl-meso-diaminopimelate peptidase
MIGRSVEDRPIEAFTYGSGSERLLFVGGIHGGYEWNSVLLAYALMDYLEAAPAAVPAGVSVTVIPSLNPDGVYEVVGREGRFSSSEASVSKAVLASGRFNAHGVDLNRNFDCEWKPEAMWQSKTVSAGSAPFSEPEARALRDFVLREKPSAAVFWHSQANAVYASACGGDPLPETLAIMHAYAGTSGYAAVESFDAYEVTGDAEGWLASIGIPALTVELKTHEAIEWERNLPGIRALLERYGDAASSLSPTASS